MSNEKSCQHCVSFQSSGFNLVSPVNQKRLDNYKKSRIYKKGEKIFIQGDLLQNVYCLRGGLIKLETVSNDGQSSTVGFLKAGDLLGIGGVLSGLPCAFSATAIEDTYACAFSNEFFQHVLKDTPELSFQYMAKLFSELRHTQKRLLSGVEKDVSARVAEALIYLKENFPHHTFTRKEIAEWAGTTTESVIRTLSQFEDDGLIQQQGRQIVISDKNNLNCRAGVLI